MGRTSTKKPKILRIDGNVHYVSTWVQVNMKLVAWLVEEGHLQQSDLPILNATDTKFLISPEEPEDSTGVWREATEGFYVDVQYSGKAHLKNIAAYLQQLKPTTSDVTLSFVNGEEIRLPLPSTPSRPTPTPVSPASEGETTQLQRIEAKLDKIMDNQQKTNARLDRIEVLAERTDKRFYILAQGSLQMARDLAETDSSS